LRFCDNNKVMKNKGVVMTEFSQEHNEYLTRKLAHYNEWLMDNKRDFGKPYPGFPEEIEMKKREAKAEEKAASKATATVAKKVKGKVAKKPARVVSVKKSVAPKAGSKQAIANEIVRAAYAVASVAGGVISKQAVIATIMKDCNMTQAGATTYFYNAVKAV
jgi:hypothetical protein